MHTWVRAGTCAAILAVPLAAWAQPAPEAEPAPEKAPAPETDERPGAAPPAQTPPAAPEKDAGEAPAQGESSPATGGPDVQPAPPAPDATAGVAGRPPSGVEEITVRARKREESMQTVPVSVTAFNEAQLERSAMRDIQDLEAMAPNVIIDLVPVTPGGGGMGIRGISFTDTEKSNDPAVGVVLDGVFLGTNTGQLLNNFDFESVEVLRGPQGTLFGRNATAGVLNVRRTRPTGEWGLKASITGGSAKRNDYKLVANLPMVGNVLSTKLSVYSLNLKGPLRNTTTNEDAPTQHYLSGAVDLLFTPGDDLEVLLKYERVYDRSTTTGLPNASDETHRICAGPTVLFTFDETQCAEPGASLLEFQSDFRNDSDFDMDAITAKVDYDLGDYSIASITGWRGHHEDVFQDFDGTAEDFFSTRRTQRYDQLSEELRLHGNPVEGLNFVLGAYYFFSHYDIDQTTFFLFDQPLLASSLPPEVAELEELGLVRIQNAGQYTHSIAGFLHADYELLSGWRLAGGARFTREQKEFYNDMGFSHSENPDIALWLVENDQEPEVTGPPRSWAQPTFKVGTDYQLPDSLMGERSNTMLYGHVSTGFKSGGYNGRADPAIIDTFEPETVLQYEVGIKTDWADRRLFLNLAAFWTEYNDKQEQIVIRSDAGAQETRTFNASDATIRGAEAEISTTPLRGHSGKFGGLRIWGSVGLLDAQYNSFIADLNPFDAVFEEVDNSGFEVLNAPKYQLGAGSEVPWEFDSGRVYVYGQYRHRGEQRVSFTTVPNTSDPDRRGIAPAVGQFDGSVNLELDDLAQGDWRLTVFVRNLANQVERGAYIDVGGLFAFQGPTPMRIWGVELQAEY